VGFGCLLKTLIAFCALLICAGCATSPANNVPLSVTEIAVPDNTSIVDSGNQRVSPLDVLDIRVFGSDELNATYQVDPTGQIKFPYIGPMEAKGYTSSELASVLEAKLEKYFQNPQVSVRITEVNGQQFTIEGAVAKPGMYPVRGPTTLLQAMAISGGPSATANLGGVIIFRTIQGQRKAARFDLRKIRSGESVDPAVFGNDLIVIDGQEKNGVYEEVLRGLPIVGLFGLFF
jgi:polysaccharide biosynthesis/export protein